MGFSASYRGNLVRAGLVDESCRMIFYAALPVAKGSQGQRGTTCLLEASLTDQIRRSNKDDVLY